MMFEKQKNNYIYRVSLSLDKLFIPFWNLSRSLLELSLIQNRDYSRYDAIFHEEKNDRIGKCKSDFQKLCDEILATNMSDEEKQKAISDEKLCEYDTVYRDAFDCIHRYYLEQILCPECFNNGIKKSCSLIVYLPGRECHFVTEGNSKEGFDEEFQKCLASMKVIENYLNFLNNGIDYPIGFNSKMYASVFPDTLKDDAISICSPLYSKNAITPNEGIVRQVSEYKIWINEKVLIDLGYVIDPIDNVYEYRAGDLLVGLEIGNYIIPMLTNWQSYFSVIDRVMLLWTDYRNGIFVRQVKTEDGEKLTVIKKMNVEQKAFVDAAKNDDFTNCLSYLEDNLYLPISAPKIQENYREFFHPLQKIEKLKHLVDYKIYVPEQQEGTVLGVYKIHKLEGETQYNLRHMLSAKHVVNERIVKDYNGERRKVEIVQVLKPQYSSFYMLDYFEFFVEEVLIELKAQGVIKDFLRNQNYKYKAPTCDKDCEIDALVYAGSKIYMFELKTTLHFEFLKIYPQRYADYLTNEENPGVYEFYLISSFAEDNIAVLNVPADDEYNTNRAGLNTKPYRFDVAIPGKNKVLHCLAESSYQKLKAELQRIFTS